MKKIILAASTILFFACNSSEKKESTSAATTQDKAFDNYKNHFVEELWKTYPEWASSVGYHKYDSVMTIYDASHNKTEMAFLNAQLDSLKSYDVAQLSSNNKTDYELIQNQLKSSIFNNEELHADQWNPSIYNISGSCAEILAGNYEKLDLRVKSIFLKLRNAKKFYEAAKQNIFFHSAIK